MTNTRKTPLQGLAVAFIACGALGCAQAEVDDGPQVLIRSRRGTVTNTQKLSPEARARRRALSERRVDGRSASQARAFAAPAPADASAANGRLVGRARGQGGVAFVQQRSRTPDNGRRLVDAPDRRAEAGGARRRGSSLRFRRAGYDYDNATCIIGPRYEFSGVDGPDEGERAEARRLRPQVKVDPPEAGGRGGKNPPKPKPAPVPIPAEDMLVSAGG